MTIFNQIKLAANSVLRDQNFFVGIEKIDNYGNMKYSSTGKAIPSSFWRGVNRDVRDGMDQNYLGYYPSSDIFHDAPASRELSSVCEFSMETAAISGLYKEIDILKNYIVLSRVRIE